MKSLAQMYMDAGKSNLIVQLQEENASLKSQLEAMAKALEACMTEDDYFNYPKADAALSAYRNTKEQ